MVSKETAFQKISQLVERFSEQIGSYKHSDYNETLTRRDFIDPFFKALGWDMDNEEGNAEAYREVIHEDKIKIGSATKAPDYSFRLAGGKRLFFVEAKKPSVFVKEEIPPAYQIRRYGWSAKLPISIVTDFEEFAIYDCTKKPKATDKASTARIKYLNYKEYITEFDFLWDTFSKERVLKGSFDKFVTSDTGKKGTATVDKEFLESLNEWRKMLAESISINNIKLNEDQLNFAVQQTLDRIIFLRICEDRGVEPYEKLKYCLNSPLERGTPKAGGVYSNLFQYFEEADKKYNSGLFDLKKDEVSHKLSIENKVLKKIIEELYYPVSPYEFSVLSVEILGSAYEQFLGKVIRLTPSHKAKIEEKPEVRKAGGVYYTPQYIVDYIVKNTVGKLVEGKTPKEVEKIKIVDPACGSGSFLIGAYQYLLDWHLSYYMQGSDPLGPAKAVPLPLGKGETLSGQKDNISKVPSLPRRGFRPKDWRSTRGGLNNPLTPDGRLTTAEKKKILINNIYGVDIDTQAVEVTKLSLLLKCMEGETLASVQQTMSFMHERILPTLENNIKSGNSLIDLDFYEGELEFAGTERKIKPFNWQAAFPEVFRLPLSKGESAKREGVGGFDCVIGNPPYGAYLDDNIKQYLTEKYKFVADFETSQYFLARGENLLKNNGLLSFIIPNTTFLNILAKKFREYVLQHYVLLTLTDLANIKVFEGATVRTSIPFLKKGIGKNTEIIFQKFIEPNKIEIITKLKTDTLRKNDDLWISSFSDKSSINIKKSVDAKSILLSDILEISQGLIPYDKYRGHDEYTIKNRIWNADYKKNKTYKKELRGGDVKRYVVNWNGIQWISYGKWLAAPRKPEFFTKPRLLFREITDPKTGLLHVGYTDKEYYNNPGIINGILLDKKYSLFYLLGIANSKLIAYLHFAFSPKAKKGVFPKILVNDVRNIRIPKIDFTNPAEKKKHDEIVKHVETMLELNKDLQKAKLATEQEQIKQRISYTDKKIDALVYELYGLTEDEIKIVEGV